MGWEVREGFWRIKEGGRGIAWDRKGLYRYLALEFFTSLWYGFG